MQVDEYNPSHILVRDEAFFHSKHIELQHTGFLKFGITNSYAVQQLLHAKYTTAWYGFMANFILCPYFSEKVTLNEFVCIQSYLTLGKSYFLESIQRSCLATSVFMQEGSTTDMARHGKNVIHTNFPGERVISRTFLIAWPKDHQIWTHLISGCHIFSDVVFIKDM